MFRTPYHIADEDAACQSAMAVEAVDGQAGDEKEGHQFEQVEGGASGCRCDC